MAHWSALHFAGRVWVLNVWALRTLADPNAREAGLERTNDVRRRLHNRGLPTTYFVGADMVIDSVYVGELTPAVLTERLASLGSRLDPLTPRAARPDA